MFVVDPTDPNLTAKQRQLLGLGRLSAWRESQAHGSVPLSGSGHFAMVIIIVGDDVDGMLPMIVTGMLTGITIIVVVVVVVSTSAAILS